ncbi:hypothetical protein QR680_014837 [Steinernema hermaphroditum]|uniref:Peptidase M16 N-terminal domain-containing protein n=1 Tax=Steinernema hermaphroditum TaxID=289476 RepID=A0AA39ICG6_9BILA|nr:hypothetical protein QR680_014837 [Steinernema hermaphroditum]
MKKRVEIASPPYDQHQYRGLKLSNGLKVILVSHPYCAFAFASMSVKAGSFADPDDLPGLAHMCEHLLSMGTEKYPAENDFFKFVSKTMGTYRAETDWDWSNYYITTRPHHLEETLDRLVDTFVSPLFTESSLEKEVQAVDSEFKKYCGDDVPRMIGLESMLTPEHDFRKFMEGNYQTLMEIPKSKGISIRDEVATFFEKHYSSNIMTLCVFSNHSLYDLEQLVLRLPLHEIKNNKIRPKPYSNFRFSPDEFACRVDLVPVGGDRTLTVKFAVRNCSLSQEERCELLEHAARGSAAYQLMQRGWATSVSAFSYRLLGLKVKVMLSKEGLKHVEEIVELLFMYIGMLRRTGPHEWFYDELSTMEKLFDELTHRTSLYDYISDLSERLLNCPLEEDMLVKQETFDPNTTERIMSQLIPTNMMFFVSAKENSELDDLVKKGYYNVEYRRTALDKTLIERFEKALVTESDSFFLPQKNEYIPTKIDANRTGKIKHKLLLIEDNEFKRIWTRGTSELTATIYAFFGIPNPDAASHCMTSLFEYCFTFFARSEFHSAKLAKISFSFDATEDGFKLEFFGLAENITKFVSDYVNKMLSYKPEEAVFKLMRDEMIKKLKDEEFEQPRDQAVGLINAILMGGYHTNGELLAVLETVTYDAFLEFISRLWNAVHLKLFVNGNFTTQEVTELSGLFHRDDTSMRPLTPVKRRPFVRIPERVPYFYEHTQGVHSQSCLFVHLQFGVFEPRTNVLSELLFYLVNEPAFDTLRTKEQLGYTMETLQPRHCEVQGLAVVVQGDHHPLYVEQRVDAFFRTFRKTLEVMSDEEFQKSKEALKESFRNMQNVEHYWQEIRRERYLFNKYELQIAELSSLTKPEFLTFYDRKIMPGSTERQRISVRVCSTTAHLEEDAVEYDEGVKIMDIGDFKLNSSYYTFAN